ncbi:hypothetical protein A9Q98_10970 [Thalassotalea sp. 42_200_T64]|nr:hypothetical protein A9Q98_10970 [Thalassotalea sp. 42_200_T64]
MAFQLKLYRKNGLSSRALMVTNWPSLLDQACAQEADIKLVFVFIETKINLVFLVGEGFVFKGLVVVILLFGQSCFGRAGKN